MPDPGALSSRYIIDPQLRWQELNIFTDLMPMFRDGGANCTPRAMYEAMINAPPSWVSALAAPNGDLPVVLDFENGRYWNGTNGVDYSDLLTTDADWGSFDAANIVASVGLIGSDAADSQPVLAGAALTLSGATYLLHVYLQSEHDAITIERVDLPDYNEELNASVHNGEIATQGSGIGGFPTSYEPSLQPTPLGNLTAAFTLTATHAALSITGQGPQVRTIIPTAPANNIGLQVTNNVNDGGGSQPVLRLLAIYPPQSDADMTTMAATL